MGVTWKVSSYNGEEFHEASYRGCNIVVSGTNGEFHGSIYKGLKHYNCGYSTNLDLIKSRTIRCVDNVVSNYSGNWHEYPGEKPEVIGDYIITYVYLGKRITCEARYTTIGGFFDTETGNSYDECTVAWTRKLEPYDGDR